MFKLIRNAKGLRALFNTLITSLPAIFNVGSLLFLLMFVYAVLAMNLYGGGPVDFHTPHVTFNNIGNSLNVMFRCAAGGSGCVWGGRCHVQVGERGRIRGG